MQRRDFLKTMGVGFGALVPWYHKMTDRDSIKEFYMFSASGLAKKNIGDIADFSGAFPNDFSKGLGPKITEKYDIYADGFIGEQGESGMIHNILAPGNKLKGAVVKLEDTVERMYDWYQELERFEASYGMASKYINFSAPGKEEPVMAKIYFLINRDSLRRDKFKIKT